jgi:hypothetical protein
MMQHLTARMLRAVRKENFELWNAFLTKTNNPPTDDPFFWIATSNIYATDVIKFCNEERINVSFEATKDHTPHEHTDNGQAVAETIINRQDTANYKELAEVFHGVKEYPQATLTWFKDRCSDYGKYQAFKSALVNKGERGGRASTFSVLQIAVFLHTQKIFTKNTILHRLHKRYPSTAEEFQTYTPD